tara:strand:- start:103 stop:1419 length:1317 start_codon:yes stop_codon:yes gene_type:complete
MDTIDINKILNRSVIKKKIKDILIDFELNKKNLLTKRGIYVYGNPGSGKSHFIKEILSELQYDMIMYDAGDIRNKSIIETITNHNMSDQNILSMFYGKVQNIAIVMDEIDGMNSGDKGGINSLIKLIRPKKTKKQKLEDVTLNPIICIGNYHVDKKIKELMKVCHTIELKNPKPKEIKEIIEKLMPSLEKKLVDNITIFVQGDLRKLNSIINIYKSKMGFLKNEIINNIFHEKSYNEDTKKITKKLINSSYEISDHNLIMNETDRTIVGLLWHENIIDVLNKVDKDKSIPIYTDILDNICFSDYIDRITFQKQIWQFNEMSSLTKTFYNNHILHKSFESPPKLTTNETRFTKVLTKYSTEYNNVIFIQNLCQNLNMDKKDVFSYFLHLRNNHEDEEVYAMLSDYEITKLDVNRIYRYLDKYTKPITTMDDDNSSINSF